MVLVERTVLEQGEHRAVYRGGAGFGDHVHLGRHRMASLGRVMVGHDVELLDAFHGEVLHQSTDHQVFVVATVHVGVNLTAIAAVDADVAHAGFSRVKPHPRPN